MKFGTQWCRTFLQRGSMFSCCFFFRCWDRLFAVVAARTATKGPALRTAGDLMERPNVSKLQFNRTTSRHRLISGCTAPPQKTQRSFSFQDANNIIFSSMNKWYAWTLRAATESSSGSGFPLLLQPNSCRITHHHHHRAVLYKCIGPPVLKMRGHEHLGKCV